MADFELPRSSPLADWTDVHQISVVAPGSEVKIWSLDLGDTIRVAIKRIGNSHFDLCSHRFVIDDEVVENNIVREWGLVFKPLNLDPPFWARQKIEWFTKNNSTNTIVMEVLIDGDVYYYNEWLKEKRIESELGK